MTLVSEFHAVQFYFIFFQMKKLLHFAKKNKVAVVIPVFAISYIANDLYRSRVYNAKVAERNQRLKEQAPSK